MDLLQTLAVSTLGGIVSLSLKWLFDLGTHKLKIRGQKDVFIHQVQFEKEFNAYAEIWVNIPNLTNYSLSYDDFMTDRFEKEREKEFTKLLQKTGELIAKNDPFLHPTVFDSCVKFVKKIEVFQGLTKQLNNLDEQSTANAAHNNGNITDSDEKKWQKLHGIWQQSLIEIMKIEKEIKNSIRSRIWDK